MNLLDAPTVRFDKLSGAGLRAFAESDDGTRTVLVELDDPGPPAAPPAYLHSALVHRKELTLPVEAAEDWPARMDALERDLAALRPDDGPVRLDLARGFVVTVTPAVLRALTRLRRVGVVRPRQGVQAG